MEIEKRRNSISEKNLKNNKKAGRPPHKPTEQSRNMVKEAVGMGIPKLYEDFTEKNWTQGWQ